MVYVYPPLFMCQYKCIISIAMKLTDRAETINVDYHRSQQGVQNELPELRRRRIEWSPFYKVLSFILNLYVSWIPVLNKWRSPFTLRSIAIWRFHRRQFLGCFKILWQGSRCAGAWHIDTKGKYVCTTYDRTSIVEERTPGSEERLYRVVDNFVLITNLRQCII